MPSPQYSHIWETKYELELHSRHIPQEIDEL